MGAPQEKEKPTGQAKKKHPGQFLKAPGNYRARWAVLFSIPDGSFKSFENYTLKLLQLKELNGLR